MYLTKGFTLIELMVAISIAAILVTIGIPSFFNLI
ncbi:MAG: prepilin-type N-terminal cleavage/methylation domain-containing protein, partial [Candidatus Thiodiazotropha sp. (ex Lucinoma annulata)]|nr:prepilin-type N-terminal cleavage/methylation domain-containing protein [Candidatus Thiodiazotropha sp. (ex Lucinoma annulata)]